MIKKDYFEAIKTSLKNGEVEENDKYTLDDLIAFCDKELERLEASSKRSRERQAEKVKTADELAEKVFAVLTSDFMDRDEVYEAFIEAYGDEDVSVSKVQYRLNALAKEGRVQKSDKSILGDDGKKHTKVTYSVMTGE